MAALSLNTQLYPTNITDVRQAIVHAINYSEISQQVFFGETSPLVGPEYPVWKDFYYLGNFPAYSYNVSLAKSYLNLANISNIPQLTFNSIGAADGCDWCSDVASAVQEYLGQIGITVDIQIQGATVLYSNYGSYSFNVNNSNQIGQISLLGGPDWAPDALTPADNWVSLVSNTSLYGNYALYYNPNVQAAIDAFTTSNNVSYIKDLVQVVRAQMYQDAPYAWLGVMNLPYGSGSLAWQNHVVSGFFMDPLWTGGNFGPVFNTVRFV